MTSLKAGRATIEDLQNSAKLARSHGLTSVTAQVSPFHQSSHCYTVNTAEGNVATRVFIGHKSQATGSFNGGYGQCGNVGRKGS